MASGTNMYLCFGCQHSFPQNALEKVEMSAGLESRLHALRLLVSRVQPATSAGRQAVSEMEDETRALLSTIRLELDEKMQRIRKLEAQLSYANKENEDLRRRQQLAVMQPSAPPKSKPGRSSQHAIGPTHMLERFLSTASGPATARPPPSRGATVMHLAPTSVATATVKANDLVSATIYSVLEALVVRSRAEVGLIWLRPQDNAGELFAPFIAGLRAQHVKTAAPYRVPMSSLQGSVAATGVAANLSPAKHPDLIHHATDDGGVSKAPSFTQLIVANAAANLVVPIFSRYGEHARSCIGAIHLIGSQSHPFPFGLRNETETAHAALLLSHIITTYLPTMLVEWSTRIYDPSTLLAAASYEAELDQRPSDKGVDDFDSSPMMVFRSASSDRNFPRNLAQTKSLKADISQSAVPFSERAEDGLRDVHQSLRLLEENWKQSVNLQTSLEKKVETLTAELEAARQGLHTLAKSDYGVSHFRAAAASLMKLSAASAGDRSGHKATSSSAMMTAVDVEDMENDVTQQMKKSRTATFLTPSGELSTPAKRRAEGIIP